MQRVAAHEQMYEWDVCYLIAQQYNVCSIVIKWEFDNQIVQEAGNDKETL